MPSSLFQRAIPFAVAAVCFAAQSTSISAQSFLDRQDPDSVRVVSYNVHQDDLFRSSGTAELSRMINAVEADVYSFQEAFDTSASEIQTLFNSLAPLGGGDSWQVHKGRNQVTVSKYAMSMQMTDVPNGTRGIAMSQIDLPDMHFQNDLYLLNNHFPCCGNEQGRLAEARAIAAWIQDAINEGGDFDLEPGTAISLLGDFNIVDGPTSLNILLDGENGLAPDWDGTSLADAKPTHNNEGVDEWTWRNDTSQFEPGILDYVLYTDSVLQMDHGFVLNPSQMSNSELQQSGLLATDFMLNKDSPELNVFDHLPLIVDFVGISAVPEPNSILLVLLSVSLGMTVRRRS